MNSRLFAGLVLVSLAACQDSTALHSATNVTLTVTASFTNLRRAQSDTITMTLTNAGPWRVRLSGSPCEPRVQILDEAGAIVVPPGGAVPCTRMLRQLDLAPGERFVQSFVWETDSVPRGFYSVSATFTSEEVQLVAAPLVVELN